MAFEFIAARQVLKFKSENYFFTGVSDPQQVTTDRV